MSYIYCVSIIWGTDTLSSLSSLSDTVRHCQTLSDTIRHCIFVISISCYLRIKLSKENTKYFLIACYIPINFPLSSKHTTLFRRSTLLLSHIIRFCLLHYPLQAFWKDGLYRAKRTGNVTQQLQLIVM